MMRFIAAIAGILISILPLIFFWVGAQTFNRPQEKALAMIMVILSGALLLASGSLLFSPSMQRLQWVLLAATIIAVAAILVLHRTLR